MNDFQKNVNFYGRSAPQVAIKLPYINTDPYQVDSTEAGEANLAFNGKFYHSKKGAAAEAQAWFSSLDLKEKTILYVYGIGLGYYYEAAKDWLRQSREHRLIFLENDPAVLCRFFETERASRLLRDKQVQLHFFQGMELDQDKMLFERLSWSFINQLFLISALQFYAAERQEMLVQLEHKIPYDAAFNSDMVEEYMLYGVSFYGNYYKNLLSLPKSHFGDKLFGKFKKIPAIICGAGPSLHKQLPLLKSLTNSALIFSGGSALNALSHEGILPHFSAGVDPNEEQYKRLMSNNGFEVPFFYRSRMNHQAFRAIHGPKLYLSGAGGYETAAWFDEKLKLRGKSLDEGHNVINLCLEIAQALGCDPIILVGMDLAFTDMQAYAPGVVSDAAFDQKLLQKDRAFLKENIYGEKVYTLWKWVAEADWIGKFAKENPRSRVINATEGGLGFPGVPNQTFQEVADRFMQKHYDLHGRVHGEIQNSQIKKIESKTIINLMNKLVKSLTRCINFFDQLLAEEDRIKKILKENKGADVPAQTGVAALIENELAEEPGYLFVLDIFNQMYMRAHYQEIEQFHRMRSKASVSPAKIELKRIALNLQRYQFLKLTAQINQYQILEAINEFKGGGS